MIEEFSTHRPDQALDERVGQRHVRDRLDFIDLQNPKIPRPPVRLEYWIMISTEMSRYSLPMNGSVEHAGDVRASHAAVVHAEADEPTRELVYDHEHPVSLKHDRLAAKQIEAPETVCRVADERQRRRSGAAGTRTIVLG